MDVGNIRGDASISASGATVETSGKVSASSLSIKGDDVRLTNKEHDLGTLAIDTKKLDDIYDVIYGRGMFEAMRVKDKLDLAVSDQDIILTDDLVGEAALSIKARHVGTAKEKTESRSGQKKGGCNSRRKREF